MAIITIGQNTDKTTSYTIELEGSKLVVRIISKGICSEKYELPGTAKLFKEK